MIHSKINKDANSEILLVEFSRNMTTQIEHFYQNCKDEKIKTKTSAIYPNQINFYIIKEVLKISSFNICLENIPSQLSLYLTTFIIKNQEDEKLIQSISPINRTILIREGLEDRFYFDYQFENTLSEKETILYLCSLSTNIINAAYLKGIGFYDQKIDYMRPNSNSSAMDLWKNIFYQIPGIGKEKALAIAQKYPSYQSILRDSQNGQQLKSLLVQRGLKQVKLGKPIANKIYKVLMCSDKDQMVNQ